MIRHFIIERGWAEPRSWNPNAPDPKLPRDCPYLGKALVEMERCLGDDEIHCYLTWDSESLPEYGPHVVAILIGEEWGLIPRYARHVRLVARVVGRYPFLGIRKWWPISALKAMLMIKFVRNWLCHLRSWILLQVPPSSWPARIHNKPAIVHLPWGSATLIDVPMKEMNVRPRNYFFSGAVAFGADHGFRKLFGSPKLIARKNLVNAVADFEKKHPEYAAGQGMVVHSSASTGELSDAEDYAQRLMNSKICLAPRGSTADTWRFFEGMKSGCAIVTNPLPDEWYYRGAPALQIDDWDELEEVLLQLLRDDGRLEELHRKALTFWADVCGETALGRFLAKAVTDRRAACIPSSPRDPSAPAPVFGP